jgi:methylenetetrahydrofolate--tRNA-(uracil-5-)-methyltransferase
LERHGRSPEPLPWTTALGALGRHLTASPPDRFQPANINYGLFPELAGRVKRRDRRATYARRAWEDLEAWAVAHGLELRRPADESRPAPAAGAATARI